MLIIIIYKYILVCCFKVIFIFLSENLSEPGNSNVVKTNFGVDLKARLIMISLFFKYQVCV